MSDRKTNKKTSTAGTVHIGRDSPDIITAFGRVITVIDARQGRWS